MSKIMNLLFSYNNLKNHWKVLILKLKFKINERKQTRGQLSQNSACETFTDMCSDNGFRESIGSRNTL